MKRIPYDQVAFEANKILNKILASGDEDMLTDYYDKYYEFIRSCGWTIEDFEKEELSRIDKGWDSEPNLKVNKKLQN